MAYRKRDIDTRTFVEIWHSLPDMGKDMLVAEAVSKGGISRKSIEKYANGVRPERSKHSVRICSAIRKTFGVDVTTKTLFPSQETINLACELCIPKWDGKVEWPSLQEDEDE